MAQTPGVIKVELLFSVVVFAVWIFTLADIAQTPARQVHHLPKIAWAIIVLLFPILGSIAWFVLGRPEGKPQPSAYEREVPSFPEYDRRGRAAAADPEKDEAFLRQVRERAEAQRKRHDAEKRRLREQEGTDPS